MGKGENAGNQHFLLFPQCFLPFQEQISILESHLFCRLQILSIWTSLKFWLFGKELTQKNHRYFQQNCFGETEKTWTDGIFCNVQNK